MDPAQTLLSFIASQNIHNFKEETDVRSMIVSNYHLLSPEVMKQLVATAIQERDAKVAAGGSENDLLGSWGVIIDIYKEVTIEKRDKAGGIMQQLCAIGMQGGRDAVTVFVKDLRKKSMIDSVLVELIASTYAERRQYKGNEAIIKVIEFIFAAMQPEINRPPQVPETSGPKKGSSSGVAVAAPPSAPPADDQEQLVAAGELLRELIKRSAGDAKKLRTEAVERLSDPLQQTVPLQSEAFQRVLEDNIEACRAAGYVNKTRIFEFLREVIRTHKEDVPPPDDVAAQVASSLSMHHAPQFVDDRKDGENGSNEIKVSLVSDTDGYIDAVDVSDALRFAATGTNSDTASKYSKTNKKNKSVKTAVKRKVGHMAEEVGRHLEEFGWAVCDHTIPEDLVRRVRIESGLFTDHYEQAEIWVGKQADIGAQLVVPSVRGDKVLWMCGGHNSTAPEGVSRTVRTIGEIEPCKLEIKAQAPIKSFKAMKELVAVIDKLVFSMKEKCPSLSGIYERSDAMLSIYPGNGARFAKHIDNTTRDGRRLTVLVYLNPNWEPEEGGALRLFTANNNNNNSSSSSSSAQKASSSSQQEGDESEAGGVEGKEEEVSSEYEGSRKVHCKDGVEPSRMTAVDVFPQGGRLAMFYSADVPHEVLPTFGMRHAITIWYYDTEERKAAVEAAVEAGHTDSAVTASLQSQTAAKDFIAELMGGDEVGVDGGDPTESELAALSERVSQLDDEVLGMVANITGAPSVSSFREGFPLLAVEDLKQMRALFRRMGLAAYDIA